VIDALERDGWTIDAIGSVLHAQLEARIQERRPEINPFGQPTLPPAGAFPGEVQG
jgi:hypothetical protein